MPAPVSTLQLLHDGARNVVVKATFLSGGLDQAVTPIVTVSALNPNPGTTLKVTKIHYDVTPGGIVRLYWDSPPIPTDMMDLNGFSFSDFRSFGGITNNGGPNATGNILISTQGFTLNYVYTITLEMIKGV
jgi:hypothetical protein